MAKDPSKLTLSPTKVDTFYGCRRLFLYNYLRPPFPQKDNKYFAIGNIAHKALELFHSATSASHDKALMSSCFKMAYKAENAAEKLKNMLIDKNDLYSIKKMLKNYLNYLENREETPNVVSVEKLAKVDIGGAVVWLKSDRVDLLGDSHYNVVDYKSGKPATKKAELDSVQLPSYGHWIRQSINKDAKISGEYLYLKFMDTKRGIHGYDITDEMMDLAEEKYSDVSNKLKNGCKYRQNFKYKYCNFCDYKRHCLEDESDDV